jgi:uncharacterized protein YjbJ (UPF0337 family)
MAKLMKGSLQEVTEELKDNIEGALSDEYSRFTSFGCVVT